MRVLLLNQYYHPDIAATAQLATDLGEELCRRGHEVHALASNRFYSGAGTLPRFEQHRGVHIHRVPATAFGRGSRLLRMIDYATFSAGIVAPLFSVPRPDVIVALTTPPWIALVGLLGKELRSCKLVSWVMDVYPEVAKELGALDPSGPSYALLGKMTRLTLERSDAVIALDEAMRDRLVAKGAKPSRTHVIDNWCDGDLIRPAPIGKNRLRQELGLGDRFTVCYSGNMGLGHDFETLVGAMRRLCDEDIVWLFIGDGPRREALQTQTKEALGSANQSRLHFLPYQPREALPVTLTAAHLSFVGLDAKLGGLIVPSKLYGTLAAGVPVLYVGPTVGRVFSTIEKHRVGLAFANGDAKAVAHGILELKRSEKVRSEMGARARTVFDAEFARPLALQKHIDLIERGISSGEPDAQPGSARPLHG